ncbi:MAG: choice-of-anchor V domain-containing protein [Candidatus Binatia bacterium]
MNSARAREASSSPILRLAAVSVIAGWVLHALPAHANRTGIVGRSGKQGAICTQCHGGGARPTVTFSGPSQLAPGAMATFRFEVQAGSAAQTGAGFNVASSAGTLAAIAGQGAKMLAGELTHSAPKDNDASHVAGWDFSWTAPTQPGTYRLFGAGNSVNLNNAQTGDNAAATTLDVVVGAVAETPTATPTATAIPATATASATATRTATQTSVPTATPTGPTRTPTVTRTPGPCFGDCDGSGAVTIGELITAVNIALGSTDLDACPSLDSDGSGTVTVNELIAAVNNALTGC